MTSRNSQLKKKAKIIHMNLEQLAANILRSKSDTLRLRCFEGVLFNILRSNGAKTTYDEAKDLALV
jgi:hypothetical protein